MKNKFLISIAILFVFVWNTRGTVGYYPELYKDLPFEMPEVKMPVFGIGEVNLMDFGGKPDGTTLNTDIFRKSIDALSKMGGGMLVVPEGIWYTGPIVLKSNINLHLKKGAMILFTEDKKQYPIIEATYEGQKSFRAQSPISANGQENIGITGEGVINGSGDFWRPVKRSKVTEGHWKSLVNSGGILKDDNYWLPSEGALRGQILKDEGIMLTREESVKVRDFLRPVMISISNCKNILLQGVTFENSPNWNLHPLQCENLIVDGITVRNPSYSQNGDGLDIESCKNVIVVNSIFDVGDDAICLKSGKDEEGRRRGVPSENVIIENCTVYHGHGGFVVGSEMSGGVRNVSVKNCQFIGTNIGLRFKSARGRGGVVENIYVDKINMYDMLYEPISFSMYYFTEDETHKTFVADETTPKFRNIFIKNITSRNSNKALNIGGLPEQNIENLHLENLYLSSKSGAEISDLDHVSMKNITILPISGPVLSIRNVKNLKLEEFHFPVSVDTVLNISGGMNSNLDIPESIDAKLIVRK